MRSSHDPNSPSQTSTESAQNTGGGFLVALNDRAGAVVNKILELRKPRRELGWRGNRQFSFRQLFEDVERLLEFGGRRLHIESDIHNPDSEEKGVERGSVFQRRCHNGHITGMSTNTQAVLVTGSAKGIGHAVVERLSREGMLVYAGVRRPEDAEKWRSLGLGTVHPLLLEVTDEASIAAAAQEIGESLGGAKLVGLVNNAGIAVGGPLEFLPVSELRRQLEINVIGQIAVTQAVLPLLRQSQGRIVNMGSIAGRSALPMMGAYAASKFALEALTDALRVELIPAGIEVSIIEPGVIATPIWDTSIKAADEVIKQMPREALAYYGRIIEAVRSRASGGMGGLPPAVVADAVVHALTARRPKTRYLVGKDARARVRFQKLPDRLRDRIIARRLGKI